MARVSTYLNFARSTEDAFNFYRSVFGTEFGGPIMRFGDIPAQPGQPPLAESDKNLVMHIELPILAGHVLMGTDAPERPHVVYCSHPSRDWIRGRGLASTSVGETPGGQGGGCTG